MMSLHMTLTSIVILSAAVYVFMTIWRSTKHVDCSSGCGTCSKETELLDLSIRKK
jgi:hypothetical protein